MLVLISIIISAVFLSIGLHYKRINDMNGIDDYDYNMYRRYHKYRYSHPRIYYNKISRIAKRLRKGKKISPYEKKLITEYLHEYMRDEMNKGNNIEAYTNMLENDSLDDEELIAAFFADEDNSYTKESKNYSEEENSMMGYFDNEEINNYSSYFNDMQRKKSHNLRSLPEKLSKYCENLTTKSFKYNPAVGRDKELEDLMITILTPGKSALLLGKARSW